MGQVRRATDAPGVVSLSPCDLEHQHYPWLEGLMVTVGLPMPSRPECFLPSHALWAESGSVSQPACVLNSLLNRASSCSSRGGRCGRGWGQSQHPGFLPAGNAASPLGGSWPFRGGTRSHLRKSHKGDWGLDTLCGNSFLSISCINKQLSEYTALVRVFPAMLTEVLLPRPWERPVLCSPFTEQ